MGELQRPPTAEWGYSQSPGQANIAESCCRWVNCSDLLLLPIPYLLGQANNTVTTVHSPVTRSESEYGLQVSVSDSLKGWLCIKITFYSLLSSSSCHSFPQETISLKMYNDVHPFAYQTWTPAPAKKKPVRTNHNDGQQRRKWKRKRRRWRRKHRRPARPEKPRQSQAKYHQATKHERILRGADEYAPRERVVQ